MKMPRAGTWFFLYSRAERLIATGRMVLAAFFLLAIWLDPSTPSRYARLTCDILVGYLVYSLTLGAIVWRRDSVHGRVQVVSHTVDLIVFAVLMFLTEGPTSPFFVYFVFLLVCATLRWQWRGTIWTAAVALATVILLAWYPPHLLRDQAFELNRFIIRLVYLAVVATLLGYLGAHEQSMRNVLARLAGWPRSAPDEPQAVSCAMLRHAAEVIGAPRVLLVWEEEEEPWLHLSAWSPEECRYSREHPAAFGSIVAEQLAGASFFSRNAGSRRSPVIMDSPEGLKRWEGVPLHPALQERFAIGAVLASRLKGEMVAGYLLVLDKPSMTADGLVLGNIVAREVAARLDHICLMTQLQQAAASDERVRLARDLHDGLLQTLTGAVLQLESAQRLMETEPQVARQRIQETQRLLATEQRDLRSHINELRPYVPGRPAEDFELAPRLAELADRIRLQWNLSVEIATPPSPRVTRSMAREIYLVVHEALINAVRHADASALRAELTFGESRVHITVTDDGHGFSFRGRYDQDELFAMKRGPVTLKERIAALGGRLAIDSRETGARLEIALPLAMPGG